MNLLINILLLLNPPMVLMLRIVAVSSVLCPKLLDITEVPLVFPAEPRANDTHFLQL
jgi:hypothetical protein